MQISLIPTEKEHLISRNEHHMYLTVDGVTMPKRSIRFCFVSSSTTDVGLLAGKRSAR